ncbi:MAG: sigma-54-dependent transcriptional regulator [Polyangiales bacterium]
MTRILVVEDEAALRLALSGLLRKEGHTVTLANDAKEGIAALAGEAFDLVITDLSLGRNGSGLDVLAESKRLREEVPVIVITAHGSEKVAVDAMRAGATHYLPKPFDNDELRMVVARELDRTRLAREHRMLLERVAREQGLGAMIGTGPAMRRVFDTIARVAETDLGVLVRGESGTGKELVAQALHEASGRRARSLQAVNCAAISAELVESELFGHEKGAFTGADARRIGRFEAAAGGTLFLDEIGDMPLPTQAKVLRVLESRTFGRVGSTNPIKTDARVIAATHRDLAEEAKKGRFREDLYYRLHVVEILVPPLRERREDIPALAISFAQRLAQRISRPAKPFSERALAALCGHGWPGNVRELRNTVEQAAVLAAGDTIEDTDLRLTPSQSQVRPGASFADAKQRAIETFERTWLAEALAQHGGNVSRTAAAIGLARQSLQQKLRELGLRGARDDDG